MADNTQLNVGASGDIIATDDIAGVKHQRVKIEFGNDGSATDVSATNPLPVTGAIIGDVVANAGTNLNTSALALEATLQSVKTAVELIDNFISGTKGLVTEDNSAAIKTAVETLAGKDYATQTTLAAILAKIIATPATEAKQDSGITQLTNLNTVLGAVADAIVAAGAAGSISAKLRRATQGLEDLKTAIVLAAGNNNIGDVDVASMPAITGTVTANIGTTNGLALDATQTNKSQFTKLTDGTNDASVKAASTAAVAADKALVVAVSPNNTVGVTGTFWQATQPVSGTVSVNTLPAGTNLIGKVGIDQTTPGTTNRVDIGAALPAGTNAIGKLAANSGVVIGDVNCLPPVLTKGTQSANGLSVQSLKDAGRVSIALTIEVAGAATTEGLATVTESRDGAATATFTSKTITSGKRLRFQHISIAVETLGSGTAPQRLYLRLRSNGAGATTASSPIQGVWVAINSAAVVKSGTMADYSFPDGFELVGDGTRTYGITLQFPDWVTTTATVQAKVTVIAFEY